MTHLSCFGLPSVLNFRSPACQGCADNVACATAAQGVLESLQVKIDLKAELEGVRHFLTLHTGAPAGEVVSAPDLATTIAVPTRSVAPDKLKIELTDAQKVQLSEMPVKVAEKLRALIKSGVGERALPELRRGANPFSRDAHAYLADAGDLLLAGGFNRGELAQIYTNKYSWTRGTAKSRVSATVGVLLALELAVEEGDRLVLSPKAKSHNEPM